VWVEGIQRVICGVSDDTTCQDVVVALAHAIGKTGRFTLIERWKDTERLLSPTEQPLLSLHKWGEYASDVQFILRRTKSSPDKRNGQFSQHNFSPHFPELPQVSGPHIKKSLTFSGAHTSAKSRRLDKRNAPENSSGESQKDLSSLTSLSSKSSSSPYNSLEKRPKPNLSQNVHSPSLSLSSLARSPNRTFTNTASSSTFSLPNNEKLVRTTPVGSPQKSNTVQNLAPSRSSQSYVLDINKNTSKSSREPSPNKLHHSTPSLLQKSRLEEYDLDKHLRTSSDRDLSKVNGDKVNGVKDLPEKVIEGTDKESLLQLIKEQQEKLENQESSIKSIDIEIRCWEDKENDYVQKSENIKSEVLKLQKVEVQLNSELRELQLLESNLESQRKNEQKLKSEINVAKSRLSHSDKKLEDVRKKKEEVLLQLEDLRKERDREIREAKDKEISMLQEISKLQKEINNKLKEHESQQESMMALSSEVKDLDAEFSQKQNQLTTLEAELKETNLTEFLVLPADAVKEDSAMNRSFPARPGSARKLTHPSLLRDMEATPSNPHGLWV